MARLFQNLFTWKKVENKYKEKEQRWMWLAILDIKTYPETIIIKSVWKYK